MATTQDVRIGSIIKHNGQLCTVVGWQHTMPGKGGAFYQCKMKNIETGKSVEARFRSGENVDVSRVEIREFQYLYEEGDNFVCMNNETFDQIPIPKTLFGGAAKFIQESMQVKIHFGEDEAIMGEAPTFVELDITYTEPGIKGDTATNSLKPATVETGAEVRVPLFVNSDDRIKIDTRTGEYVERVKK
jgi:elongation factor P